MVFPMPRYHFDIITLYKAAAACMMSKARYTAVNSRSGKVAVEMIRHGFSAKNRTIEIREDSGQPFVRVLVLAKVESERLK
jgi:hypothetical protein